MDAGIPEEAESGRRAQKAYGLCGIFRQFPIKKRVLKIAFQHTPDHFWIGSLAQSALPDHLTVVASNNVVWELRSLGWLRAATHDCNSKPKMYQPSSLD